MNFDPKKDYNSRVKLWVVEHKIGCHTYSNLLSAVSYEHAREMAESFGAKAAGGVFESEISAISASELMAFVASICHEAPLWLYGAEEQLEAFLSLGRTKSNGLEE